MKTAKIDANALADVWAAEVEYGSGYCPCACRDCFDVAMTSECPYCPECEALPGGAELCPECAHSGAGTYQPDLCIPCKEAGCMPYHRGVWHQDGLCGCQPHYHECQRPDAYGVDVEVL